MPITSDRTFHFNDGTVTVRVTETRTNDTVISDRSSIDHLLQGMEPIARAVADEIDTLIRERGAEEKACGFAAEKSMTLNGATFRSEVEITSTRNIPSHALVLLAESILDHSSCMLHLLDPELARQMAPMAMILSMLGELGADPSQQGRYGSPFDPDRTYGDAVYRAADRSDDDGHTGMYL